MDNNIEKKALVLSLSEKPLFPETFTTLMVARDEDVELVNKIIASESPFIGLLKRGNEELELYSVGTLARITRYIKLPNNCLHVFISAIKKVNCLKLEKLDGAIYATYEECEDDPFNVDELTPYTRLLKGLLSATSKQTQLLSFATDINIANIEDPKLLSYYASAALTTGSSSFLQDLLETTSIKERIEKLLGFIKYERDVIEKENSIKQEIANSIKNKNKEFVLREQIKALNNELNSVLGIGDQQAIASQGGLLFKNTLDLEAKAREKKLPDEYRAVLDRELEKFNQLDKMNPEYMLTKLYIENILALPFSFKETPPSYSIEEVKRVLEADHYGMKEVKERIIEFLASRLKSQTSKGAIICLAGPPGVGKTSVGYSIAAALKRKFYRFSVGGMRDESEIKGHRRTYVGAMPGKIIEGMKKTGVTDPVFLIDEIDKMGESYHGDPASALLEVLDPEQNTNFQDFYLDLPYDLSHVLFIVTANDISKIPSPLLDRMEIIELGGYTPNEKLMIGKQYLIPKLLKKNGLKHGEVTFSKDVLRIIAEEYAREAGVRNFEKLIDKVMRKVDVKILSSSVEALKLPYKITAKNITEYLGKAPFPLDEKVRADREGTALGLAWTSMGGDVLLIEAEALPGKGELTVTGQLGNVMKESVSIALTTLKNEAYIRGADLSYFTEHNLHIHIPEGAVPKDGPSAGITLFTALWSMYSEAVIKEDLAMTGELTLTGKVMAIGGLKEKILAARRNGVREIIIPSRNVRDLDELADEVKGDVSFHPVDTIEEVMEIAFSNKIDKVLSKTELNALNLKRKKEREDKERAKAYL